MCCQTEIISLVGFIRHGWGGGYRNRRRGIGTDSYRVPKVWGGGIELKRKEFFFCWVTWDED
jgi:hypothetical protein